MGFYSDLSNDDHEVSVLLPDGLDVINDAPLGTILLDKEKGIEWSVSMAFMCIDLNPQYDWLLEKDVTELARIDFEAYLGHKRSEATEEELEGLPTLPIDSDFDPVIEQKVIDLDIKGNKALYVIRRLSLFMGDEIVCGSIVIPTENGTYEIGLRTRAQMTGMREALLTHVMLQKHRESGSELSVEEYLQQEGFDRAEMDSRKHDSQNPADPLSLIRDQMDRLVDHQSPGIQVNKPFKEQPKRLQLDNSRCTVTPPKRYLYAHTQSTQMGDTVSLFSRMTFTPYAISAGMLALLVFYIPGVKVLGDDQEGQLKRLAEGILNDWVGNNLSEVKIESRMLEERENRMVLETETVMISERGEAYNLAYWIVDTDGSVFRFDGTYYHNVQRETVQQDLNALIGSWVPNPSKKAPTPYLDALKKANSENRKWWKFW